MRIQNFFLSILILIFPYLANANEAAAEMQRNFTNCLSQASNYVSSYCSQGLSAGAPPNQVFYQMSVYTSDAAVGEFPNPFADYVVNFVCGPPSPEGGFYFYAVYQSCAHPKAISNFKPNIVEEITRDGSQIPKEPFCPKAGSIIQIDSRSVGESVAISGSSLSLVYQSQFDVSRKSNRTIELRAFFDGEFQVPRSFSLKGAKTPEKRFEYPAIGAIEFKYIWDPAESSVQNQFVDSEIFSLNFVSPFDSGYSASGVVCPLGTIGGVLSPVCPSDIPTVKGDSGILERAYQLAQYKPSVWGLGGWTLDVHHYYDSSTQLLFQGTGSVRKVQAISLQVESYGQVNVVSSEDASEVYFFDQLGRHLETRSTVPEVTQFKFFYLADSKMDYILDRNGKVTKVNRDSSGNAVSISAPYGQVSNLEQNSFGRLTKFISASGAETRIEYQNQNGLLSKITYPSGLVTEFSHTEDGLFLSESKSTGGFQQISDSFENLKKLITFSTAENVVSNYADDQSQSTGRIRSEFDASNSLKFSSSLSPDGLTENINGEDLQGQTTYQDDPRFGSQARFANFHFERTFGHTNIGRSVYTDREATFKSEAGPLGIATYKVTQEFDRHSVNPVKLVSSYDDSAKSIEIFSNGILTSRTILNSQGQPVRISSHGLLDSNIFYDSDGRVASVSNGRAISSFAFGENGFIDRITSGHGTISFERDLEGRITKKTLPGGDVVRVSYTRSGNVEQIIAPNGEVHRFQNNLLDKVSSYIPPSFLSQNGSTSYSYDLDGRLKTITKPGRGVATFYYKSGTSWLERIATPDGDFLFQNIDSRGRAKIAKSPDGTTSNTEYLDDNVVRGYWYSEIDGVFAQFGEMRRNLNSVGQVTGLSVGDNGFLIEYDAFNRIKRVGEETFTYTDSNEVVSNPGEMPFNRATQKVISNLSNTIFTTYDLISTDSAQEMTLRKISASIQLPNGTFQVETSESVDSRGNVTLSARKFSKDSNAINEDKISQYFEYDANNRLTHVDEAETRSENGQQSMIPRRNIASYDFGPNSNNNIKAYEHFGKRTVATYGPQDRLIKLQGAIERNFEYSEDGTLSKISNCLGEKKFQYDFFGNLKSVTLPNGKVISYMIDAYNRRVAKLIDGQVDEVYTWYDQTRLAFVRKANQSYYVQYFYGPHSIAPTYLKMNGITYKVISTWKGDIRYVVDLNGKIVQEIQYDEYGNTMKDTSIGRTDVFGQVRNTPLQPLGFASGLTDFDTKMIRFGARDYDPVVGRWTAKDPIGFAGGDTNLYSYCGQNPVNCIDPTGLYWFRQDWQTPGEVGRVGSIVPPAPEGQISDFFERHVPAGYTFGQNHDRFVDWGLGLGAPDWLVNIPSMIPLYGYSVGQETLRSVGIISQPTPPNRQMCK